VSALLQAVLKAANDKFCYDVSSPIEYHVNGLPFTAVGRVCIDTTGPVAYWHQGLPFAANGRLFCDAGLGVSNFNTGAAGFTNVGSLAVALGDPDSFSSGVGYLSDEAVADGASLPAFTPLPGGSFPGPTFPPNTYSILGFDPVVVFDAVNGYYEANDSGISFGALTNFTRASTATKMNSSGTLVSVASGEPRIGHHVYEGGSLVNKGMLLETQSRTNTLTYSQDFTNPVWLTSGLNSTIAMDFPGLDGGPTTAGTLRDDNAGGTGLCGLAVNNPGVTASSTHTFSVYAKAAGVNYLYLTMVAYTSPSNGGAWFDLVNGTVGTEQTGYSGSIQDMGNGWFRCSITFTLSTDTGGQARIILAEVDGSTITPRDGSSALHIYGAQLEVGATMSSLIPTAGSIGTRAAETLSIPSANLPDVWTSGPDELSFALEAGFDEHISVPVFFRWQTNVSNRIEMFATYPAGNLTGRQEVGGVDDLVTISSTFAGGLNEPCNIAMRNTASVINIAANGADGIENGTPASLVDLSAQDLTLGTDFMGTISLFRIWAEDIGNDGIELAT